MAKCDLDRDDKFELEAWEPHPTDHKKALDELSIPAGRVLTFHMVHMTHLDLGWYWGFLETTQMALDTIRWMTALLEEHPDAKYSHAQVFIIQLIQKLDPRLFARFRDLVVKGQIELESGEIAETDHNIPLGESIVRQFLYGQLYLQRNFGVRARTIVNSDSFGHAGSLPQIFRQAGLNGFIFKRPRQKSLDLPEYPFIWKGVDGTDFIALRFINKGYGLPSLSQYYKLSGVSDLQEKVNRNIAHGFLHLFGSHCQSDAGGMTPYVRPIEGRQYKLQYSTVSEFWRAIHHQLVNLPTYEGGLNCEFQGCYTTHIEQKEYCRKTERMFRETETLCSIASLEGHGYPFAPIEAQWQRFCVLQFHDIIAGTGSPSTYREVNAQYEDLLLNLHYLKRRSQLLIDRTVPPSDSPRTIVIVSTVDNTRIRLVRADVEMARFREKYRSELIPDEGLLVDDQGKRFPYQVETKRLMQRYIRGTMLIQCEALPTLGTKVLRLLEGATANVDRDMPRAERSVLENSFIRAEIGEKGILRSLTMKDANKTWLNSDEAPMRIEAWPETAFQREYGTEMKAYQLGLTGERVTLPRVGEPEVTEQGLCKATIRTRYEFNTSRIEVDTSVYRFMRFVEIRINIDWQESDVLVRLCIVPKVAGVVRRYYGIPFGYLESNGTETEIPVCGWACIAGEDGGVAILNVDRPGHSFAGEGIRISLVRSVSHEYDPCTDRGIRDTVFRVLPFSGPFSPETILGESEDLLFPPIAWQAEATDGENKKDLQPLRLDPPLVRMAAFKPSEDRSGYVLRLVEPAGRPVRCSIHLSKRLENTRVYEANLLEDIGEGIQIQEGRVPLYFRPFEIKTIVFRTNEKVPETPGKLFG
ncbi:MAG: hypothetical protein JW941_10260 [Candidatus Coatesbacteria bacterium]|nr:hypothetical protein [Candidatus Coatesbacteria bacterium]